MFPRTRGKQPKVKREVSDKQRNTAKRDMFQLPHPPEGQGGGEIPAVRPIFLDPLVQCFTRSAFPKVLRVPKYFEKVAECVSRNWH